MSKAYQMSIGDYQVQCNRKPTRAEKKLSEIDEIVDWDRITKEFSIIDKTSKTHGGRPRKELRMMCKILFIQYLYNLSDPELEDQLNDRLSFQRFAEINLNTLIPDYSTIWRFKESLNEQKLTDKLFNMINNELDARGLFLKKGSIIDATIIQSGNRPLSQKRRQALSEKPSSQIDTDAQSTKKNGRHYFGYKGHVGVDKGSDLIRKKEFTPANKHDSTQTGKLISGDELSVFGDKAYSNDELKRSSRADGKYYGILDKARRGQKLSNKQKKRNKRMSAIRAPVEHPFSYMKNVLDYELATARTLVRNELRFTMNCIVYNVLRAGYLMKSAA